MSYSTVISPLAPENFPHFQLFEKVKISVCAAGIKKDKSMDLCLVQFPFDTKIAGVFSTTKCPSAPLEWCKLCLPFGTIRALIVNSGNANAFTGKKGEKTVEDVVLKASTLLNCQKQEIYLASTGVIGEPLEPTLITSQLNALKDEASSDQWQTFAQAIMTTDTFPKGASCQFQVGSKTYTIQGVAKGAGMIAPDMATMLGFIVTDFPLSSEETQRTLSKATDCSFNSITVDSDTSTSDTVLLASLPGLSVVSNDEERVKNLDLFEHHLNNLCTDLAQQIVKDGEGAKKFISIHVRGAETNQAARIIGKSIANSPLVKTAIAGEDANWGRIVMAVGKSGEKAERDLLRIDFGDICVAHDGERSPSYSEEDVSLYMKNQNIDISVNIGIGNGQATVWTCDLTHDYIDINADYRT